MDKFIERSLRDNADMHDAAVQHGLILVDVSERGSVAEVAQRLIDHLREGQGVPR